MAAAVGAFLLAVKYKPRIARHFPVRAKQECRYIRITLRIGSVPAKASPQHAGCAVCKQCFLSLLERMGQARHPVRGQRWCCGLYLVPGRCLNGRTCPCASGSCPCSRRRRKAALAGPVQRGDVL